MTLTTKRGVSKMPPRAAVVRVHLMPWIVAGIIAAVVGIGLLTYFAVRIAARLSAHVNSAQHNSTVLKPAETGSTELAGELTTDTARVNGVKCPVYRRSNGTHFALVGGERIDVERVAGYARTNGNAVAGHYRTVADGSRGNNFSADLHK